MKKREEMGRNRKKLKETQKRGRKEKKGGEIGRNRKKQKKKQEEQE